MKNIQMNRRTHNEINNMFILKAFYNNDHCTVPLFAIILYISSFFLKNTANKILSKSKSFILCINSSSLYT